MPDHFIVLRHQDGDAWDYMVITHLGPKATVEAAGPRAPDKRDLSAWHNDTFVNGPSWEEFHGPWALIRTQHPARRVRFIRSSIIALLRSSRTNRENA
jgi:hypothetical protein